MGETLPPLTHAYIIYRPKTADADELVTYSSAAYQICSFPFASPPKDVNIGRELSAMCARWRKILLKKLSAEEDSHQCGDTRPVFIDLYQSGRRSYAVRGLLLSGAGDASSQGTEYLLFLLERVQSDFLNISQIARQLNLNKREQDLIKLLLTDLGNKQIAHSLGLSLNTVKTYLKLLMRKLGVTSRAGIIARLIETMGHAPVQHDSIKSGSNP